MLFCEYYFIAYTIEWVAYRYLKSRASDQTVTIVYTYLVFAFFVTVPPFVTLAYRFFSSEYRHPWFDPSTFHSYTTNSSHQAVSDDRRFDPEMLSFPWWIRWLVLGAPIAVALVCSVIAVSVLRIAQRCLGSPTSESLLSEAQVPTATVAKWSSPPLRSETSVFGAPSRQAERSWHYAYSLRIVVMPIACAMLVLENVERWMEVETADISRHTAAESLPFLEKSYFIYLMTEGNSQMAALSIANALARFLHQLELGELVTDEQKKDIKSIVWPTVDMYIVTVILNAALFFGAVLCMTYTVRHGGWDRFKDMARHYNFEKYYGMAQGMGLVASFLAWKQIDYLSKVGESRSSGSSGLSADAVRFVKKYKFFAMQIVTSMLFTQKTILSAVCLWFYLTDVHAKLLFNSLLCYEFIFVAVIFKWAYAQF